MFSVNYEGWFMPSLLRNILTVMLYQTLWTENKNDHLLRNSRLLSDSTKDKFLLPTTGVRLLYGTAPVLVLSVITMLQKDCIIADLAARVVNALIFQAMIEREIRNKLKTVSVMLCGYEWS